MRDPVAKDRTTGARFQRLVEIMAALRGPEGCPWDREQDLDSLRPMLIEEVYEVIEAVDDRNYPGLAEELGDLLLHVVFHARLAEEDGQFAIDEVLDGIAAKLVRRHPHVFGEDTASSSEEVLRNWEEIKKKEKADAGAAPPDSLLDGIPRKLPALHEAHKISSKVARAGFEWPGIGPVIDKLEEEIAELKDAIHSGGENAAARIEEEIGDLLFTLVNVARHAGVDSESALNAANRKFRTRWRLLEKELEAEGLAAGDVPVDRLEKEWRRAKAVERGE